MSFRHFPFPRPRVNASAPPEPSSSAPQRSRLSARTPTAFRRLRARLAMPLGTALVAFGTTGCLQDSHEEPLAGNESRIFVAASDFQSGVLVSYDPETLERGPDSLEIASDAALKVNGNRLYVLERWGADNILRYDPATRSVVYQEHLGDGWNPADMAFDGEGTAYVSLMNHGDLLRWSEDEGRITGTLDLSDYRWKPAPGDTVPDPGVPNASALALRNDTLFVALQRRGIYPELGGPAMVVLVDTKDFSVMDTLVAPGANAGSMWLDGSFLYLVCSGFAEVIGDGGLFRWDLGDGSVEEVFDEDAWEGSLSSLKCLDGVCAGAQYMAWQDVDVRLWATGDAAPGSSLGGLVDGFGGVVWDETTGRLFVGERSPEASGLLVYAADGTKLDLKGKTPLPPSSLASLRY